MGKKKRYSEEEFNLCTMWKQCIYINIEVASGRLLLLIVFWKNMTHQKIYKFWYSVVSDEVPSTSPQIVEQIKFIQEVALPGIPKLNDSALDEKKETKPYFLLKKDSRNGFDITYYILLSHQLMGRVIKSTRTFIIYLKMLIM